MRKFIWIGENVWTFSEVGTCKTIETKRWNISLISPMAIFRIWKNKEEKYTADAWKTAIAGIISRKYFPGEEHTIYEKIKRWYINKYKRCTCYGTYGYGTCGKCGKYRYLWMN